MPRKNANARKHTGNRTLQAVPDPTPSPAGRTAAEDKLWAALHAHPATTTADLATHAGIGRSTAGKFLSAWAGDGSVTRTPGPAEGGRRSVDTWTISDRIPDDTVEPAANESSNTEPSTAPPANPVATVEDPGDEQPEPTEQGETEQPSPVQPPPETGAVTPGGEHPQPAKGRRLDKGALRGMVEDYLTEHPAEQFSPSAIGKALNRSPGAVANVLDKLVAAGYAVRTHDKPKRYAINATSTS